MNNTIIIGWPTIARLAHGETVNFDCGITLIPDDLLFNTANQVQNGNFEPSCKCITPVTITQIYKCTTCGKILKHY